MAHRTVQPWHLEIRRISDLDDPGIVALVARSDEYLSALYPPESNHAEPLEALIGLNSAFFAGYLDRQLAVCGAVKIVEDDPVYAEIKRVFVAERFRGRGLATRMMQYLEDYLLKTGVTTVRLEAGPRQPEALKLYAKLGYSERGPFGSYRPDPLSVFMEKILPD